MAKNTNDKLTEAQGNQVIAKALVTSAKQVESKGVEKLPAGSYPFNLNINLAGELLVKNGTPAGDEITRITVSPNDVLRGLLATLENPETAVSEALGWHKSSDKNARKSQDGETDAMLLKLGKRRKLVETITPSARAGAVSAKPSVLIGGSVGTRSIDVKVAANG